MCINKFELQMGSIPEPTGGNAGASIGFSERAQRIADGPMNEDFFGGLRKDAVPPVKDDGGKVRLDLLPTRALEEVARVMEHGAKEYGDHNWAKMPGLKWSRYFAAAMRHLWAWWRGEDVDPKSGRLHLAHAAACVLILLHYGIVMSYHVNDDRPGDI